MTDSQERCIGRLEGIIERLVAEVAQLTTKLDLAIARPCPNDAQIANHEKRIGDLEESRTLSKGWIAGALFAATGLGGVVVVLIQYVAGHFLK